jgi:hypothetical protein
LISNCIIFFGLSIIFRGDTISGIILGVYLGAFTLSVLPVLILHTQYLISNHKLMVIIDSDLKVIEFRRGTTIDRYSFTDIKSLDYYATTGHISKKGASPAFYSFDSYRFYKLRFSNNKTYYLTCLLMNDIEHRLEILINTEADWHFRALPLLY